MQRSPIVIVGGGPSASHPEARFLAEGAEILRMNWFFLEKERLWGDTVDYLFLGHTQNPCFNFLTHYVIEHQIYRVKQKVSPYSSEAELEHYVKLLESTKVFVHGYRELYKGTHLIDDNTFSLIHKYCPYPFDFTTARPVFGTRAIVWALCSGYKDIRVVGIDFYTGQRVYVHKPHWTLQLWWTRVGAHPKLTPLPAYAARGHTIDTDIRFLKEALNQFPDAALTVAVDNPEAEKIWTQIPNVTVHRMRPAHTPKPYFIYKNVPWLYEATKKFAHRYGVRYCVAMARINIRGRISYFFIVGVRVAKLKLPSFIYKSIRFIYRKLRQNA